jgi:hypothetical protein
MALQETTEAYLVGYVPHSSEIHSFVVVDSLFILFLLCSLFEDTNLAAIHAKRVTIQLAQ